MTVKIIQGHDPGDEQPAIKPLEPVAKERDND